MTTASTLTKLTLADIGRRKRFSREGIARETGVDFTWVCRIFSRRYPTFVGSVPTLTKIASALGLTTDEFLAFLREECGKNI